jgi:hypothetical protein
LAGILPHAAAVLAGFGGMLVAAQNGRRRDPRRPFCLAAGLVGVRDGVGRGGMRRVRDVRMRCAPASLGAAVGFVEIYGVPLAVTLVLGAVTAVGSELMQLVRVHAGLPPFGTAAIDAALAAPVAEAERGERRHETHVAYARSRKRIR